MSRLLILFCLIFSMPLLAMDARELVRKMNDRYLSLNEFEVYSVYELFKGHKSNEAVSSYKGYYQKTSLGLYQKIDETESIAGNDFFLMVSGKEKMMVLESPKKMGFNEINFNESFSQSKETVVKEKDGNYIVLIYLKANANLGLSLLKLTIDKKTFQLHMLDMYYSDEMNFSESIREPDYAQAHLRISYSKFSKRVKEMKERFVFGEYFTQSSNKLVPAENYKEFEFIDNRKKVKS